MEHRPPMIVRVWFRMKRQPVPRKIQGEVIGYTNGKRRAPTGNAGCYAPLIRGGEDEKITSRQCDYPATGIGGKSGTSRPWRRLSITAVRYLSGEALRCRQVSITLAISANALLPFSFRVP